MKSNIKYLLIVIAIVAAMAPAVTFAAGPSVTSMGCVLRCWGNP